MRKSVMRKATPSAQGLGGFLKTFSFLQGGQVRDCVFIVGDRHR